MTIKVSRTSTVAEWRKGIGSRPMPDTLKVSISGGSLHFRKRLVPRHGPAERDRLSQGVDEHGLYDWRLMD